MAIIEARSLEKRFGVRRSAFAKKEWLKAVDDVSFSVERNRVFSIVGESGCGKSTVARLLLKLLDPSGGEVLFKGRNIFEMNTDETRAFRRAVQIVFQDPFASLNPRRTVYQTLSEPLQIHRLAKPAEMRARVMELLESVGLGDVMERYPHEFSGGQRQRICIARALAVSPEIIIADEPLSALDVSIQAQILNLLGELKGRLGMSYVFISHDLRVVEYISDEVAVMYLGRIVEQAPVDELFSRPRHPYTQLLLSSTPKLKPGAPKTHIPAGEVPTPINMPPGCPFHPRCPRKFEPCDKVTPKSVMHDSTRVACHLFG